MAQAADTLHNSKIKAFQQKVLNHSCCDIRFYDKFADYMLECCHAEAKPNTLSLFSFLPLFILTFLVHGPSTLNFVATILCLLVHQLLDIANKKQAYRLNKFTLATYYIDHIFDALSCCCIVLLVGRLIELQAGSILTAIFFFGMLPFYTHHLAMYNNEYMTFYTLSPNTQGLILIKLLFFIGAIYNPFFTTVVFSDIIIRDVFIGLATMWLLFFLFRDFYAIIMGKRVTNAKGNTEQHLPAKNLFVIFMIGYIVLQMTSIEPQLIQDSITFYFAFSILTLVFAQVISELVLAYGYQEQFKQVNLAFLLTMGALVVYYVILVFGLQNQPHEGIITKVLFGVLMGVFLVGFVRNCWKNIHHIESVLDS